MCLEFVKLLICALLIPMATVSVFRFPHTVTCRKKSKQRYVFFPNQAIFRKPENVGAIDFL